MRYINTDKILTAQLTTPAENPLVGDDTRLIDVSFDGSAVRKQLFKKVHKTEQEARASSAPAISSSIREPSSSQRWSTRSSVVTIGYQGQRKTCGTEGE